MIPAGSQVLDPVGTAPGVVVPGKPAVIVLPGPPRELQPMWRRAVETPAAQEAIAGRTIYRQDTIRMFGLPESGLAETLLGAGASISGFESLEITTCLRRGEIEVATSYEPPAQPDYDAFLEFVRLRHAGTLFSDDGTTIDEQVARLLAGRTIAVAESCTGGLLAARLTDRAGSSAYFPGGIVAYSNEAKISQVAEALASGAGAQFEAEIGVGITGVAGPGGGTPEKPVGLVCISVCDRDERRLTRSIRMPGGRSDIRDRSVTVAMHLVRRLLQGQRDDPCAPVVESVAGGEAPVSGTGRQ
jgi:nicotinamide-nucleotide amidase